MIDKNSQFYITATKMLSDYVAGGGNVDDLGVKDEVYKLIKYTKIKDDNGNYLDMETKFKLLGYPRARARSKDNKQELIDEINEYKQAGKSFHITRKKLPFYPRLHAYAVTLKRLGVDLTYEQIMKGLGYKDYSDTYFRCMGIFDLQKYRDENGHVDSYRKNAKLKAYIVALGETLNLPYYLVVTLLADEELSYCYIDTEYIENVKIELQRYVKDNGSLKGIKTHNRPLYHKFHTLMKYYGDGSEFALTAEDWLDMFELHGIENNFRKTINNDIDIEPIMNKIKQDFGNKTIRAKDIDGKSYRVILKKAVKLGIPVKELFRQYSLKYDGNVADRLSSMKVTQIPYLTEMRALRDNWLQARGITSENGYCEEEIFEAKVEACHQAYNKFKDKMFNFTVDETIDLETEKIDL